MVHKVTTGPFKVRGYVEDRTSSSSQERHCRPIFLIPGNNYSSLARLT